MSQEEYYFVRSGAPRDVQYAFEEGTPRDECHWFGHSFRDGAPQSRAQASGQEDELHQPLVPLLERGAVQSRWVKSLIVASQPPSATSPPVLPCVPDVVLVVTRR